MTNDTKIVLLFLAVLIFVLLVFGESVEYSMFDFIKDKLNE